MPGSRPSLSLDGEWRFIADPERLHTPSDLPTGEPIQVPGCWEAQVSRPYRIVTAWYRRSVDIPKDWAGERSVIRFGAVMYRCVVFVNGTRIGEHEGGYTPFEVEAGDAARPGGSNDLVVYVVNPLNAIDEYPAFSVEEVLLAQHLEPDLPLSEAPHGKQTWYSSQSGIWLSVSIERRPAVALAALRITPDVPGEAADVHWAFDGQPHGGGSRRIELIVSGPDGSEAARATIDPGDRIRGLERIALPSPKLWDIDQPNLYRAEASLVEDGAVRDVLSARFGMREIRVENRRIILNGRPVYLLGALDQDLYPDTISTPPSRDYLDAQVRLAREMGINLLRCHIKVPAPEYLDAADEAGILVWCELPNWSKFTSTSAARGRATLEAMVEHLGNHPSIIIWTIINEDWGTELRFEARDRHWLRSTYDWLKALDPSRLIVDNSACETPTTPNFHVRTDIADFHVYFVAPDNAIRWRNMIDDYARDPAWLWSPHGDADRNGAEPLLLSEFGSWGLPRLDKLVAKGREPWWFGTGRHYYLPAGLARRFKSFGLDRIWSDVSELADATQWHQFEGLQYEIGQIRRHGTIQGYVVTELSDAYWEANGLLDAARGTKVYHERLRALNADDAVVADLARRDLCSLDPLAADISLSAYGGPASGGRIAWDLEIEGERALGGELPLGVWPDGSAAVVGRIQAQVPDVEQPSDARLILRAETAEGRTRASNEYRLAIMPSASRRSGAPLRVGVQDPLDIWSVRKRLESLGHEVVADADADLLVATEVTPGLLEHTERGGRALVLVRTRASVPESHDLARRVQVHLRRRPHSGWPGQRSPWEGDWVTSWSWLLHEELTGLPKRNPLDFAYEEVLPDHVLLGYDPARHRDEVPAGMFVGWVHTPAALVWTFRQAGGAVTLTTFRVAPETGPVATALLERLVQHAAVADRRSIERARSQALRPVGSTT